jgi:hypothetical protein
MTIPIPYLWPLGCLAMLGAIHAAFCLEEIIVNVLRRLRRWE